MTCHSRHGVTAVTLALLARIHITIAAPSVRAEGEVITLMQETIKLSQVLTELRMSRSAFYRMRALGHAPRCLKLPNGQIRVRRADLDAWLAACEEMPC